MSMTKRGVPCKQLEFRREGHKNDHNETRRGVQQQGNANRLLDSRKQPVSVDVDEHGGPGVTVQTARICQDVFTQKTNVWERFPCDFDTFGGLVNA